MSDYLWDKTGEPDAEVERLETLLASFGHAPRPLALPSEAAAEVPPRVRRAGAWRRFVPVRLFEPVWLAAAAALLFAFLLGAGALMRGRVFVDEDRAASHDVRRPEASSPQASSTQAPPTQAPAHVRRESPAAPRETANAGRGMEPSNVLAKANGGAPVVQDAPRRRAGAQAASFVKPRHKSAADGPGAAESTAQVGTLEAMSARGREGAASLFDGTRLMAKEQLIYALRLTGAKLKEVESKAHGAGGSKPAPRGGVR